MTAKLVVLRAAEEASAGRAIDSYPITLYAHHMAAIFGVSLNAFYKKEAEGAYLFAENRPRIGRKSWSRDRVAQYFAGELRGVAQGRDDKKRMAKATLREVSR